MGLSEKHKERFYSHRGVRELGDEFLRRIDRIEREKLSAPDDGGRAELTNEEDTVVERAADAFELVAMEGLDALRYPTPGNAELRSIAVAGSYKAFGLRRFMPIASRGYMRLDQVLHNSSLAVCGGRRADLLRWYDENERSVAVPHASGKKLDRRLLYKNYGCWIRLFRGGGENELGKVRRTIDGMVRDQSRYEKEFVGGFDGRESRAVVVELMAQYLWSSATGRLVDCLLRPGSKEALDKMDKDFEAAMKAADFGGLKVLVVLLDHLHAAAKTMALGEHPVFEGGAGANQGG